MNYIKNIKGDFVIDKKKFFCNSIAALMVIFGVVMKNSAEQLGMKIDSPLSLAGVAAFAIGWVWNAYILSKGRDKNLHKFCLAGGSLGVLGSVAMMKKRMLDEKKKAESKDSNKNNNNKDNNNTQEKLSMQNLKIIFIICWVAIGMCVGSHLDNNCKYCGLIATGCVLASMLHNLPLQRKLNVVDGPGMPLFVIAWIIIVILNSMNRQNNNQTLLGQ